jgi:predicted ATPase
MSSMAVSAGSPERGLLGRRAECLILDQLLADMQSGRSSVLVVRGPAGVGKTALLNQVMEAASDCRIVRTTGVESEMERSYASLQQLCASMLDRLDQLPAPQRHAFQAATGLREGPAPDRFLVGLAVLSLLAEVAEELPLVCLVDDAQWLDQASLSTLAFVARRLLAERIVMVFAVREPSLEATLVGLPDLVVSGLGARDARRLLDMALPQRLDEQVRDRIVAEAHGNPLALLELTRGRAPAELAGGFGLPDTRSVDSWVEGLPPSNTFAFR